MRALVLTEDGPQFETAYPTPAPMEGEALIRVCLAGICATDLQLMAGYKGGYRGVLGHEFVGEVMDVNDVGDEQLSHQWMGQRVVGELNIGCGRCSLCAQGLGKHCRQRQSLGIINRNGAFADYLTLPLANLHVVPDTIPSDAAVFTEPLAAALEILEQVHVYPSSNVVVIGDGRLGLLVAQVLATTHCNLTLVGRHREKLAIVAQPNIKTVRSTPAVIDDLSVSPADIVIEATGSPSGFADARRLVRPGGTLILKSTFASAMSDFDLSSLVVEEVTLVGSRCGPFAPALRMLEKKAIVTQPLIHGRYPLTDAVAALEFAKSKGVLKVLIEIDDNQ